MRYSFVITVAVMMSVMVGWAQKGQVRGRLEVTVVNRENGKGIEQAAVMIMPYGIWAITNADGKASLVNVPVGKCTIETSMLGYTPLSIESVVNPTDSNRVRVALEPMSLSIGQVVVVAQKNKSGESTASIIGRQAIDHLQATSLKDIMQLVPGQVMTQNPSLTSSEAFTTRTLDKYDTNNAFGAAILVDGIPISNNADLNTKGGSYSTASAGVDLRSIGTDDIENVEIIRGIASAEYGDMSSGTMIVNSRVGITDLTIKGKIMPGIQQIYVGKGFGLGKRKLSTLNVNADYAYGKSDPRYKTDTYDRILASVIHSTSLADNKIKLTTKLSTTNVKDWSGPDPDEKEQDVYNRTKENGFTLSHSGVFNLGKLLAGTVKYDLSYSRKVTDSYTRAYNPGSQPLFNATQEGTYSTSLLPNRYLACGGTIGKPITYYAKVSDVFSLGSGGFKNRFNIGAEFRSEGNTGRGFYNENPELPLSLTNNRPRAFSDIPFLTQIVGYAEDNMTVHLSHGDYPYVKAQVGVRWTMIQPGRQEQMQSLSPRVNASLVACRWLELRLGMGVSEKTPSLGMLYPDKSYFDYMNINYSNSAGEYLGLYTTKVFEHEATSLKPMRSTKYEAGFDIHTDGGQSFSVVGYVDQIKNGFLSDNSEWVTIAFNKWQTSDITSVGGELTYDKQNPSSIEAMLQNVSRPGNKQVHKSYGVEYDFNFGKIRSTNTAFYLSGAYSSTKYYSDNYTFSKPMNSTVSYEKVYFIYRGNSSNTERRQFTSSLRVVQHIPRLSFVISGTVQAVLYDYTLAKALVHTPIGYVQATGTDINGHAPAACHYFTDADYADAANVVIGGYRLSDQIFAESAYNNVAETWPSLWVANLRVTKSIAQYLGLSFYVNNVFFWQPWHKSSISASATERNGNLFSYGFEINFNF